MTNNPLVIDVREPYEYQESHVEGAINIPSTSLSPDSSQLKSIPKDQEIILYCRSGGRAGRALQTLSQMGFTNLKNGINQEHIERQ